MYKVTLKRLDIYYPVATKNNLEHIDDINEDFDIDNFLHFPILINKDGSLWKYGNLYLLSKLKKLKKPSHKSLDAISTDLKYFMNFCDKENVDYLSAPRKLLRPTYLYRSYLHKLLKKEKIAGSTIKRRMSAVIGFYEYLINQEGIKFKYPLWESGFTSISYKDNYGFKQSKTVETKDVLMVASTSNPDLFDDAIVDGGRLLPLTKEQQIALLKALKTIGNTEMLLGFLIALTSGAIIQTVFTLRLKHFKRIPTESEQEIRIKVGYGTSCDTKFNKIHTLFIPAWLYRKIRIYINSPRATKRRNKAKHIFDTNDYQYIFLSNRGVPFYTAYDDPYRDLYRDAPSGGTIRQFISKTLLKKLNNDGFAFTFSFHDLRASFGMNLLDKLMPLVNKKEIELSSALNRIKERMGHSSLLTTERYLNFREINKIKELAQDDYEKEMWNIVHE